MDDAHQRLLKEFQKQIARDDEDWMAVWILFHESDIVQRLVERLAKKYSVHPQQIADFQQELWLELGLRLCKRADLAVDFEWAENTFPGWLSTVVGRLAVKVARGFAQAGPHHSLQYDVEQEAPPSSLELNELLSTLDEESNDIMLLFLEDSSIDEIAELIDKTGSQTRRLLQKALEHLKFHL